MSQDLEIRKITVDDPDVPPSRVYYIREQEGQSENISFRKPTIRVKKIGEHSPWTSDRGGISQQGMSTGVEQGKVSPGAIEGAGS